MSSAHAERRPKKPVVYHQFEKIDQQQETYLIGMWSFVVQEIMFFGPLFLLYTLYRMNYQADFYIAHQSLSVFWGGLNTANLLFSSFCIAMAVHCAQIGRIRAQLNWLGATLACAVIFMVIKAIEYTPKIQYNLYPNQYFEYHGPAVAEHVRLFYSLYFTMTGLHGLHVIIGVIVIGALMILIKKQSKLVTDYVPTEMVGLYWHFVDIVWIFLFPLFYLIPK